MFTLKFMNINNLEEAYACIEAPHYFVSKLAKGANEVVVYPDYKSQNGVSYSVSSNDDDGCVFHCCYVTNSAGKTIDHIH